MEVVLIDGADGVGSSVAFSLLTSHYECDVVPVDLRPEMFVSHVMDVENVVAVEGEYGIHGVCLGAPAVFGWNGAERVVEWELAPEAHRGPRAAARSIESAVADPDSLSRV